MKIIEHNQRLINVVYSLWFSHPQWSSREHSNRYAKTIWHIVHTSPSRRYIAPFCYYYYYYHIFITILSSRIDNVRWCDIIGAAAVAAVAAIILCFSSSRLHYNMGVSKYLRERIRKLLIVFLLLLLFRPSTEPFDNDIPFEYVCAIPSTLICGPIIDARIKH